MSGAESLDPRYSGCASNKVFLLSGYRLAIDAGELAPRQGESFHGMIPRVETLYVFSAVRPARRAPVGRGSVRAGSPASIAVHGGFEVLGFRAISSKTSLCKADLIGFSTGSSIDTSCWRLLPWTASDAGARLGRSLALPLMVRPCSPFGAEKLPKQHFGFRALPLGEAFSLQQSCGTIAGQCFRPEFLLVVPA